MVSTRNPNKKGKLLEILFIPTGENSRERSPSLSTQRKFYTQFNNSNSSTTQSATKRKHSIDTLMGVSPPKKASPSRKQLRISPAKMNLPMISPMTSPLLNKKKKAPPKTSKTSKKKQLFQRAYSTFSEQETAVLLTILKEWQEQLKTQKNKNSTWESICEKFTTMCEEEGIETTKTKEQLREKEKYLHNYYQSPP